ncbi:transporter [Aspergillus sclerotialis]|uniref:Transporter n=1 Tax=Aspergillus sclerotialis TaxID=2070753 RepID=A0A3A3A4E0_9EURO|nr:transporter [Aspergillus sclerotialis]
MSRHVEDATPVEKINEPTVLGPKEEDSRSTMSSSEMRALLRKIDCRVIPILAILYFLSFLDRGNIGNANIQGLSIDLKLEGNQYNWYESSEPEVYLA